MAGLAFLDLIEKREIPGYLFKDYRQHQEFLIRAKWLEAGLHTRYS